MKQCPKWLVVVCAIALGSVGRAAAQQTLVLANGDRVTGKVDKIDGSTWVVKYLDGEIKVPAAQIRTFYTTVPVGVRLANGTIGVLDTTSTQLQVRSSDGTVIVVGPADVAAIGPADKLAALRVIRIGLYSPIRRFWVLVAGFGLSDLSGNSRARTTSANIEFERRTKKDRLNLQGAMHRESSQSPGGVFAQTVGKYFAAARTDITLSGALFVFGETRTERDRFQDLQLRSIYDGGLGLQVISKPKTDLRFSGGGGYRKENFYTAPSTSAAILVLSGIWKQHAGPIRFGWQIDWNPRADMIDDYHLRSEASLTATAFKGLGLRLAMLDEYSSRPVAGLKKHDRLLTTVVTYAIGK
jgi:putative salt-induced outer membrane protein YdiY